MVKPQNYYVLVAGLPVPDNPLQLAPGISISPPKCDLTVNKGFFPEGELFLPGYFRGDFTESVIREVGNLFGRKCEDVPLNFR